MMNNYYQVIKLFDINIVDFEKKAKEQIENRINGLNEKSKNSAVYNLNNYVFNLEMILEVFYFTYGKSVVNINTCKDLDSYWYQMFSFKFVEYLPSLYMVNKMINDGVLEKINSEVEIINNTKRDSGRNTTDLNVSFDNENKVFGLLSRSIGQEKSNNLFRNASNILRYSINVGLEQWLDNFEELFITRMEI